MPETWTEKWKITVSKTHSKLRTSLQLADVGLIFLHDLSDLLSFQRGVQHLVQSGVSLPAVDEVHELVQRDEWLPLGATGAKKKVHRVCVWSLRYRVSALWILKLYYLCVTYLSSKMLCISGRRQRLSRNFWKASHVKSSGLSPSDWKRTEKVVQREMERRRKRPGGFRETLMKEDEHWWHCQFVALIVFSHFVCLSIWAAGGARVQQCNEKHWQCSLHNLALLFKNETSCDSKLIFRKDCAD